MDVADSDRLFPSDQRDDREVLDESVPHLLPVALSTGAWLENAITQPSDVAKALL